MTQTDVRTQSFNKLHGDLNCRNEVSGQWTVIPVASFKQALMSVKREIMFVYQILVTISTFLLIARASEDCGDVPAHSDLVVRGEATDPGDWPWIAALFYQNDTALQFMCGATLISRSTIVTAAHCVRSRSRRTYPAGTLLVVLGKHNIFNWRTSPRVQAQHAAQVVVHPSFLESSRTGTDVAFIALSEPVEVTEYVQPICVWRQGMDQTLEGVRGTVVGWGMDESGFSSSEEPRLTRLPLVSHQTCLESHEEFKTFLYDSQFCAGNRDGSGPCHGDSGSGLYVRTSLPGGERRWVLRGLVSRSVTDQATGLCDLNHFVVFTDMAKMAPWLAQNTDKMSAECLIRQNGKVQELGMTKLRNKFYYATSSTNLSWSDSQTFCRSHGLELASVESREENHELAEHFRKSVPHVDGGGWRFWLGGTDLGHEGVWTWSGTGRNFTFNDWESGQPDNVGATENCLKMVVPRTGERHAWWDVPCSSPNLGLVCEMEQVCMCI